MPHENPNGNGNGSRESNELAVAMVLDKSGSMGVLRDAVIEGFNDYLAELRTEPAETSLSLTLFDTRFSKMWVGEPLDWVPPLDTFSYRPDGMTALYDAIAHTVIDTDRRLAGEGKEHVKTLVVVMTDGLENSSTEYDAARARPARPLVRGAPELDVRVPRRRPRHARGRTARGRTDGLEARERDALASRPRVGEGKHGGARTRDEGPPLLTQAQERRFLRRRPSAGGRLPGVPPPSSRPPRSSGNR